MYSLRLLMFLLFASELPAFAQQVIWHREFRDSSSTSGLALIEASDGGYVACGRTVAPSDSTDHLYVVKVDTAGNRLWQYIDSSLGTVGYALAELTDQSIVVVGVDWPAPEMGTRVIRLDASGRRIWRRSYLRTGDPEAGYDVARTRDGAFVLANGKGLRKISSEGEEVIMASSHAVLVGVTEAANGDLIGAGYSAGPLWTRQAIISRFASDSLPIWSREFGGAGRDQFTTVVELPDGTLIAAGPSTSRSDTLGDMRSFIVGMSSDGELLWERTHDFLPDAEEYPGSLRRATDGSIVMTARRVTSPLLVSGMVLSIQMDGDTLWTYSTVGSSARAVTANRDGSFTVVGTTDSSASLALTKIGFPPTGVREFTATDCALAITPNPASSSVRVEVPAQSDGFGSLILTNSMGEQIMKRSMLVHRSTCGNIELDLHGIPPGVYILSVEAEEFRRHRVIVIER